MHKECVKPPIMEVLEIEIASENRDYGLRRWQNTMMQ